MTLEGNESDTWLFKIGTTGTGALTDTDFVVEMSGGAQACNVTWWVAEAVTLTRGAFKGDILAGRALTVTGVAPTSQLKGRVMANATVTFSNAEVLGCPAQVTESVDYYQIEHDVQGLTCEAETINIKACGDESCSEANLYSQKTSVTLSPLGWQVAIHLPLPLPALRLLNSVIVMQKPLHSHLPARLQTRH